MKRLTSLLLAAAIVFSLTSCGGGRSNDADSYNGSENSGSIGGNSGETVPTPGDTVTSPSDGQVSTPSDGQPSVPSDGQPSVPSDEQPSVPSDEQPSVPSDEQPSAPSGEQPSAPSGGQPSVPSEEQPSQPSGGQPSGGTNAAPILVSAPMNDNPLKYNVTADSVYIQDLYEFIGSAMTVELPDRDSWEDEYVYYSFSGSEANADDIEEYINAICSGGYNLELVDKTVKSYSSTFVSYAVNYTGSGNVRSTMEASFSDVECNLSLYYTLERGKIKGALILPTSMDVVDLGLRRGGGSLDLQLGGASASAGLYLMPDGSFQTDDGRLRVEPEKAVILRDGEAYTASAEFERDDTEDHLWVRNFYRDETIFFSSPVSRLMTGDVFTMRDLYYEGTWAFDNAEAFDSYRHDTPFLGLGHDGQFITPRASGHHTFEDITVRVMYWEPDVVGVYYIYARLSDAPYEIEALVAPSLAHTEGYTGAANEHLLAVGRSVELSPSRKFSPNYEVFTWELVDGSGVVELANTTSPSCTVTGKRAGTAVVRVSYSYGLDEPDVLTGIMRNVGHTDVTEYRIYVE